MHLRRSFLESLRTQLQTLANYGGVWIQRAAPNRNAYPAITIFAENETAEILSIHPYPRYQERTLTISIIVWIRGTPDDEKTESDMDSAAVDIESTVTLPSGAIDFYLVSTDFQFVEEEPDINSLTLTYRLVYEDIEGFKTIDTISPLALFDSLGSLLTDSTGDTLLEAA